MTGIHLLNKLMLKLQPIFFGNRSYIITIWVIHVMLCPVVSMIALPCVALHCTTRFPLVCSNAVHT